MIAELPRGRMSRRFTRVPRRWELVVDDTDASKVDVWGLRLPRIVDDQLEPEQPYDDDARMADHLVEINEALKGEYWETAVDLCEEALAERPRWSEVWAARDRAASYLEASARGQPTPFFTVIRGALMTFNMNRDPLDIVSRKSFLDVPDDALLQVLLCMSYPRCALLGETNKRLLALFKSKPLAARRAARRAWHLTVTTLRDNAKYNAIPTSERGYRGKYGFDESVKEELALIAKEFPEALQARHLPPYAIKRTGTMGHCEWRYSRVFGKTPDEVRERHSRDRSSTEWHGVLPNTPITALELTVSYPDSDYVEEVVFALFDLGAKATKRALDIAHRNCEWEKGCWAMHLLSNDPQLVVSEGEPPTRGWHGGANGFDLDFCAEEIDSDTIDVSRRVCQHLVEDRGVVPTVGVNMAADGEFNEKYPPEVVNEWLETAAFNKARERRMAQATQLCTSCNTQTARDAFSEEEWEREGDVRRCLACNVHECAACGVRKGPDDYPEAEWARAPGTGECRVCNYRTCSRCGTRRAPNGFSHGQWDNTENRLCIGCNERGCSVCERRFGPVRFSTEAWDASDALRVCRTCVGKKRCGGCRNLMKRKKFSGDQWAVASLEERRCKRCAAPPPNALDQVPAPPGAPGARKCYSCQVHLPREAFSKKQRSKGADARCKICLAPPAPTPAPPPPPPSPQRADLRRRLGAFYQRHNPAMGPSQIDAIMNVWGQTENVLWLQMAKEYGQRAVDDFAPSA